jgi:hypothetical protein
MLGFRRRILSDIVFSIRSLSGEFDASIALLLEPAPDLQEGTLTAEAFGLNAPDPEARDRADRMMAETIGLTIFPVNADARRKALDALLKPAVERAVAACAKARQAGLVADEAGERLAAAQIAGGYWLAPLEARSGGAHCRSSASADRRA